MRRSLPLLLSAAGAAWLLAGPAAAQEDAVASARLAAVGGDFKGADGIVSQASEEVQNDAELRIYLGVCTMKVVEGKTGEEKREPLEYARRHYAKAVEQKPNDPRGAIGLLDVCRQLAQLDVAGRNADGAKAQAKFAIEAAEKAAAANVATPDFKIALGRMYGLRASLLKSMKDVETLVSDSTNGARLLAEAAAGGDKSSGLLSEASKIRLNAAHLVHEGIPVDTEKRDDEAMTAALELATKSCTTAGAAEADYRAHLDVLRLAHRWGLKLKDKPYMQPLVPPLEGLKLQIPRAGGWTREKASADWDLVFDRNLHDLNDDNVVQVVIKLWGANEGALGGKWSDFKDMAQRRFEKYSKEDLADVVKTVAPVQIGPGGKSGPEIWHYEAVGHPKNSQRNLWVSEWIFYADKKKDKVVQLKMLDWRKVPDNADPDLAAFVASAIGEGIGAVDGKPPKKK
jgi:hypothetical protein